jgi:PmbA protein
MNELKGIAQELLKAAQAAGAEDVIADVVDTTVNQIRFSNRRIDVSNWWNEKHAVMFVAVGDRTISTDLRNLERASEAARAVVELAKRSPRNKNYFGIASGRFKYVRSRADKQIVNLRDPSRFVHDAIRGAESEGAIDVGGTMFVRREGRAIATTGGALGVDEAASIDLSVRAFSQAEASGHSLCCTSRLSGLKAKEAGQRAGELARKARDPVQGEEGKFDIIMEPLLLGSLVNSTSMMMTALRVEIGTSMFANKIGERVASKEVTFVDDPTVDSISRRAYDHEGVPTRRNVVIKDGVLKTYLHNTSTAKKFKTKTTANAGPLVPTLFTLANQPVPFHCVLVPGDWKVEEMIADTKNGLYVNNTWYTRYQNYGTGDFSTIPRDAILRIENGEITGPVKNVRVSDNMLNLWKSIDAISRDAQEVLWWEEATPPTTLPFTRARNMNITRSA